MVFVGIDIAKVDHVACAVDESGEKLTRPLPFENDEGGFARLEAWLEGVSEDASDVFVGMEATGHYWMACFSFLTAAGYACCVVNPMQVRAVRELKSMPRVKNDRVDSWLIAETLRVGDYEQTRLADDDVQSLRMLTRYRQSLKQELATVKTQCICVMDACFPEYAALFSDMFGAASLAVLAAKPTPAELSRAHAKTLAETLSEASRGRLGAEKAAELKAAARSSVGVRLGENAASFQVKSMAAQVEFLNGTIAKVDAEVRALLDKVEPLIVTIPGVSYATGRPDRRRDRRRQAVQERRRHRQVRRPQLGRVPIGQVRGARRAHHQEGIALPAPRAVARGQPREAARSEDAGLLRQAQSRRQVPPGRRDGVRKKTVSCHLRRHARSGSVRPGKVGNSKKPPGQPARAGSLIAPKSIRYSAVKVRITVLSNFSKTYDSGLDFI